MQAGLYVGVSAQLALQQRLTTIASNIANMNTAGYRAEEVKFEQLLASAGDRGVAFASEGQAFLSLRSGAIVKTDNPLDVAISGPGWLAIKTAAGTAYTRDGRLHMRANGAVETVNGNPVLDTGGSALSLDPNAGPAIITREGQISQGGRPVGTLGLYRIAAEAKLARGENASVIPDRAVTPVEDFSADGLIAGHIENANVDPVTEITRLIAVQRAFEGLSASLQTSEGSLSDAIKTLGGG